MHNDNEARDAMFSGLMGGEGIDQVRRLSAAPNHVLDGMRAMTDEDARQKVIDDGPRMRNALFDGEPDPSIDMLSREVQIADDLDEPWPGDMASDPPKPRWDADMVIGFAAVIGIITVIVIVAVTLAFGRASPAQAALPISTDVADMSPHVDHIATVEKLYRSPASEAYKNRAIEAK